MEGWKFKSCVSYIYTELLSSGQNICTQGTTQTHGISLDCSSLINMYMLYWQQGDISVEWAFSVGYSEETHQHGMVFSSYCHLPAPALQVHLEAPPFPFKIIPLVSSLLCQDTLCWETSDVSAGLCCIYICIWCIFMLHIISASWLASSGANRAISSS